MNNASDEPRPSTVIAVSALNRLARDVLESSLPLLWVRGEISNFTNAQSGHWYFSLKDATAQVRCAMFRNKARYIDWRPENGMQVEVRALVTLYEPRGEFQLNVESMRQAGKGALYEAFERLKARLDAQGLFDAAHKRPLPRYPRAIGIITSPQAAALRDVLTTLARRMPAIPVVIYPTPVQGAGSGDRIAAAIRTADQRAECDVLILCRGGGSIEDLWAFNEEPVARAIFVCEIPLVSGIGHETDFTIADFVADVRAPTPTAAAQLASPDRRELDKLLARHRIALARAMQRCLQQSMQTLDYLGRRLLDPASRLQNELDRLTHYAGRLHSLALARLARGRIAVLELMRRLVVVKPDSRAQAARVEAARLRLAAARQRYFSEHTAAVERLQARLASINPHAVLERGYAIATDATGHIVRDSTQLVLGDMLSVKFAKGAADVKVQATQPPAKLDDAV